MFGLKGGAVAVPRWIIGTRALQSMFAIAILALITYALSINGGGPVRASLRVPGSHLGLDTKP